MCLEVSAGWLCKGLSFFFSSRRRHTRSLCDWSSDVCSSDLNRCVRPEHRAISRSQSIFYTKDRNRPARSEERRVGKKCRFGWAAAKLKKKTNGSRVLSRLPSKIVSAYQRPEARTVRS